VCFHRGLHLNSNQISVLLLLLSLSLWTPPKKVPTKEIMKPQTPFVVCCFVFRWDGRAKERHTHMFLISFLLIFTHTTQKKNVRSFSQIERIFFARVASKTHFCPHKKKAEKEIFREEEHDNNNNDNNNNNNTGCTVVSSKKKTNSGTRERERRSRFFFRRATGRHDRRPRRVQVAEIRSEEHQIGVVPEKLLPMHASRLSREETGRKRRRQVRKRTQSREAELAAAQPKDGFAPRKIWEGREEEE